MISAYTCSEIPSIIFFTCIMFLTLTSTFRHWFPLRFLPSNLHLHMHDTCFINIFDSFTRASCWTHLYLNRVLFGTHTLLDKSI